MKGWIFNAPPGNAKPQLGEWLRKQRNCASGKPGFSMPTLAQMLATTTPVSPLLLKARRLGLRGVEQFIALAIAERNLNHG